MIDPKLVRDLERRIATFSASLQTKLTEPQRFAVLTARTALQKILEDWHNGIFLGGNDDATS